MPFERELIEKVACSTSRPIHDAQPLVAATESVNVMMMKPSRKPPDRRFSNVRFSAALGRKADLLGPL